MKQIIQIYHKYFKTFPRVLKYIWFFSFITVLMQELWLFHIPAFFPYAPELGFLLEKILLSFIASIILYYFTTYLPKIQKKESVDVIIGNSFFKINHLAANLLYTVYDHSGVTKPENLNQVTNDDLLRIVTRENMRNHVVFTYDGIEYIDTIDLLIAFKKYFEQYHNLIIPYIDLISKDSIKELNKIINQIYIIHDPVQLLKERTMISPIIYVDIILNIYMSSGKLKS